MKPPGRRRRTQDRQYLIAMAAAAITGLRVARGNDWWWPGLVLMTVGVALFGVTLYDSRGR